MFVETDLSCCFYSFAVVVQIAVFDFMSGLEVRDSLEKQPAEIGRVF